MKAFKLSLSGFRMRQYLLFIGLLLSLHAAAQHAIPDLMGKRVHDEAGVLSSSTVQALEEKLRIFEDSTSNQVAILLVSSLGQEEDEQFAMRVARAWKLGTKDKDNGIILLVAVDDRKMRIEVGQGLEGALPDAVCGRIIRNEMAPNFRRGDYDTGVTAAIDAIMLAVKGEYTSDGKGAEDNPALAFLFVMAFLGIFTYFGLFAKGCASWGLYAFLTPFYALFPGAVLNSPVAGIFILLTYLIGFPILKIIIGKTAWGQRMTTKMANSRRSGGWSSSGGFFGGGGGGSWGGGGGGFSGGGGSFGGGGASGSW